MPIDLTMGSLSVLYLCWLLWQVRRMRLREAYLNRPSCSVCGLDEGDADLDLYYRYGFWHEYGTAYAEPGSEIYEQRKAAHAHDDEIRRTD